MTFRRHNSARVAGAFLILLGLVVYFVSGRGDSVIRTAKRYAVQRTDITNDPKNLRQITIQGDEGEATILVPKKESGGKTATPARGNIAAADHAFQGTDDVEDESMLEFLGIYDLDLTILVVVLFVAAGAFLFLASYIKRLP